MTRGSDAGQKQPGHRHIVVIGGQRCGTTWLQQVLGAHRQIVDPLVVRPEPKFFLEEGSHAEYDRLFEPPLDGTWLLDKSTTYLEHDGAAASAAAAVPDAYVIAVLRDPVLRAHSNWKLSRRHGLDSYTFSEAMSGQAQHRPSSGLSTSPFQYIRRGCYPSLLEPWQRAFGSHVIVLQYERMVAPDAEGYLRNALEPVGDALDDEWPQLPPAVNTIEDGSSLSGDELRAYGRLFDASNEPLQAWGIDLDLWRH